MKIFVALSTAALFLSLVSVAPVYAQQEGRDEGSPAAPKPKEEAKPEHREAPPSHEGEAKPEHREGDKASKQDGSISKQEAGPGEKQPRHDGAQATQKSERAEPANHGGGGKGHIPDDRFRAHFGREHNFRVSRPVVVAGRPRFQYSGYWFEFVNPWPEEWSYDDDCYIDYVDDEYYLFNPRHPGVSLLVIVIS